MPTRSALSAAALGLFLLWGNSFVAIGYLLGSEKSAARFDFIGLCVVRFGFVGLGSALWLLLAKRREAAALFSRYGGRIAISGVLNVIVYNFALNGAQAAGVPAPIASLGTTLTPLFLIVLGTLFLGEELPRRRLAGLAVAVCGLVLVGSARGAFQSGASRYTVALLVLALAPLSFAIYTALSRPILASGAVEATRRGGPPVDPALWTFAIFAVGGTPLLLLLPFYGGRDLVRLDLPGWGALGFLAILCTVVGFLIWVRLVRHLPASAVGFTIFLNPPLTTLSKAALAAALPATFGFEIRTLEWIGGAVVLAGVALALAVPQRKAIAPAGALASEPT